MLGSISDYDDAVGLGTVTTDDDVDYPFHCTQIADGSRSIAVGTSVTFELAPRLGRWEAVAISPS
jgi:CspA family cold shock protein